MTRQGGQGETGKVKSYNWHQGPDVASLRGTMQGKQQSCAQMRLEHDSKMVALMSVMSWSHILSLVC